MREPSLSEHVEKHGNSGVHETVGLTERKNLRGRVFVVTAITDITLRIAILIFSSDLTSLNDFSRLFSSTGTQ